MNVRLVSVLAAVVVLLAGCSSGSTAGPLQAEPIDDWSLSIDNEQHSRVWTFNALQGCLSEAVPDLQLSGADLIGAAGAVSVRAGLDVSGTVPAEVEPKPMRDGLVLLDQVRGVDVPVTGCPESSTPLKFSFEVTSDGAWSADGFQANYRTAGVTRTLRWNLPVTVCSPAGC